MTQRISTMLLLTGTQIWQTLQPSTTIHHLSTFMHSTVTFSVLTNTQTSDSVSHLVQFSHANTDIWYEGNNILITRSPVVDNERMRPGHGLKSVLCVAYSALTLLVGWWEGHQALNKTYATYPQKLSSETNGKRNLE